jgi:hypothetical protein
MKHLTAAVLAGLTVVAMITTPATAFQCLARGSNGVAAWGSGVIYERAQEFAVRHCHRAGGIACRIEHCR